MPEVQFFRCPFCGSDKVMEGTNPDGTKFWFCPACEQEWEEGE